MSYSRSGRGFSRGGGFGGRRGGFGGGHGGHGFSGDIKELATRSVLIDAKKFYIDVRENSRGKFIKISECFNGEKSRVLMDIPSATDFHDRLTDFIEFLDILGSEKMDKGRGAPGANLKSGEIVQGDRRYLLDLKENHRGRFLKVIANLPGLDRSQIVIPAEGLIDVRDALTEILAEFGQESREHLSSSSNSNSTPKPTVAVPKLEKTDSLDVGDKKFSFDFGENRRGAFVRISEVTPSTHAAVTIPVQSWGSFVELVERAISEVS